MTFLFFRNAPVLLGVVTDVSGSMKTSIDNPLDNDSGPWSRSIFKIVDSLIEHDVKKNNLVFAIAYGSCREPHVFDLLRTLKNTQDQELQKREGSQTSDDLGVVLTQFLDILTAAGARYVRKWADEKRLSNLLTLQEAKLFRSILKARPEEFSKRFVNEVLPRKCRYGCISHETTDEEVRSTIRRGMELVWETSAVSVTDEVVMRAQDARKILRYYSNETDRDLTRQEVDDLVKTVEPFIYGHTPMIEALREAKRLFGMRRFHRHHKMLVVLSDGLPTDGDAIPDFSDADVKVVSIYITNEHLDNARRLFSEKSEAWGKGTRFMYDLSSSITTQKIPRTIFVKRGWEVDITGNQTRLFCQVNHPDVIDDVCSLAKDVVCIQDALADVLSAVDLDIYINKANEGFGAKEQKFGTCYANAAAAVMHLAMKRIEGREGGYPGFFDLRKTMIEKYGKDGAHIRTVLKETCPKYRLQWEQVDNNEAMKAVVEKRPVLATFAFTDNQWKCFSQFFGTTPTGVLKESDISRRTPGEELGGHAVVLTSFNADCLRFMNSWGMQWGDQGFFRVHNHNVLNASYFDVYWTLNDLKRSEKDAYERQGPIIAASLMSRYKGLQMAKYSCPLCKEESLLTEFSGRVTKVRCPKCYREFNLTEAGAEDLALTLYLSSLRVDESIRRE